MTLAAPPGASRHLTGRFGQGLALYFAALACFGLLDSAAKYLAADHPPLMVVWARYAFNLVFMLPLMAGRPPRLWLASARPGLAVGRGLLLLATTMMFFTAIAFMPLADAVAIGFVGPLFVTALSVPLLGETVGPRRWAAVAIGFLGALIIIRPGLGVMHPAAILCLLNALTFALFTILTRRMAGTDDALTMLFYTALVGTAAASLALPFVWVVPAGPESLLLMAGMGISSGLGHLLMIAAYRRVEASAMAPFSYLQLIYVTALGYLVFGDLPDGWTLGGAALIVAAGLYVTYRERQIAAIVASTKRS
ncbi:MAG: DMT family transporter [Thalassobaculales bacterium]